MVYQPLVKFLLLEMGLLSLAVNGMYIDHVSNASWDGVRFYISVKRETIQKKLDDYHRSVSNECGEGPKLFIPEKSFFPELQSNGNHLVYVDFGFLTSHEFDRLKGDPDTCIISSLEVAVSIPLLAANPTGPPIYNLAMVALYEKSRGDIPKTNFLYPYIPVDEIEMTDSGAVVRNGSDELRVSFIRYNHPCESPSSIVIKEFDKGFSEELHFGLAEPDFSFCDRHFVHSEFCINSKRVECAVRRHVGNLCQRYKEQNTQPCEASVEILNITSGFRDLILLRNDPVKILASESYSVGPSLVGLKYPCQE